MTPISSARHGCLFLVVLVGASHLLWSQDAATTEPDPVKDQLTAAQALYHAGEYENCLKYIENADEAISEDRRMVALAAQAQRALGQYEAAIETIESDWTFEDTQEGLMLLYDLKRDQGDFATSDDYVLSVINSNRFATPRDLLAIGRAALLRGGEPKDILDRFYQRVLTMDPKSAEAYYHIGQLALEKYDYELAAENFDKGLQLEPKHADLRAALATAFFESDRGYALEILEENLENNPRHVESLILMAQHHLLAEIEEKEEVEKYIKRVEAVNQHDPRPDAMRAVIALLEADEAGARKLRDQAMKGRSQDPRIDYHIGQWMSSLMRFSEAVPFFRASLEIDREFLPAKIALGQNLLRVGKEDEAWVILESVSDRDQYNVAVYNLLALHDEIQDYKIINRKNFIVRMEASEVELFGDRVLNLLEQAESELHAKYAFTPSQPILIEFFPRQEDFAVRTLGFVGGDGLLGACFGLVVTMNSPNGGATGKTNWESTLWHEYCHAVTLGATQNRMPRWLTEGISVYEERRRDPACGEQLDSDYRHMILEEDELIPLNRLNYGFLKPKSPKHMLFAYYQSSIFVEYFMETFGEEKMRSVIRDLRNGDKLSETFKKHAKPMKEIEEEFIAYAKNTAESLGEGLDWKLPEENLGAFSVDELKAWLEDHPNSYYGLRALASALIGHERYEEAQVPLEKILEKYPDHGQSGSPYLLLAEIYKRQGDREKEREALWSLINASTDWLDQMLTLLDYEVEAEAWDKVQKLTGKVMAVNPYIPAAQKALAESQVALDQKDAAISTYEKLLTLRPRNPAQIHFKTAALLKEKDAARSRRHVLDALAEAPRYRDALKLLRELQ